MLDLAICNNSLEKLELIEKEIVKALFNENELNIDLYDSDEEFEQIIKDGSFSYDMVFLETTLSKNSGFQLASMIRDISLSCEIVFLSENPKLVFDAFDYRAFDFLLYPLNSFDFKRLFERFALYHFSNNEEYFTYKSGSNQEKIKIRSILYFSSGGRKISIITSNKNFEFYSKLDEIESLLSENGFIRIHQSYLINPAYIRYIVSSDVIMDNGDYLPISRSRAKEVRDKYMQYMR